MDVSTKSMVFDQEINVCNIRQKGGFLSRILLELAETQTNFKLKCPFKKASNYKVKPIKMQNILRITSFTRLNMQRETRILVTNTSTPVFSITFWHVRVEIDNN
jgi:hypothetical protein